MKNLPAYNKTISALVTGLLGWAGVVVSSPASRVTAPEWLFLAVAAATALGVYGVSNEPAEDSERGYSDIAVIVVAVLAVIVVLVLVGRL